MSLRTKFMLALLLTGLAAVAVVGGLAYTGMTRKVDLIRREQAMEHFYSTATAYLQKYGSWQASPGKEGFDEFMQSRERSGPPPLSDGAQGEDRRPPPPEGDHGPQGDERRPPRDDRGPQGEERGPGEEGRGPPQGEGERRPRGGRRGEPPYRFILADQDFKVVLGGGVYRHGEALPEAARKDARAVTVDGRTVAYVSPEGVITPSKQELQYLDAMRDALWFGVSGAAVLAVALGLLLSRGLGRTLGHLTKAVRAMHGGSLLQRVPVEGKDEVAELAAAFNDMSEKLARSHQELQESHQTILLQAEQMRELSVRDALTKLHNRRHFDEQASTLFSHAVRHKRPLAMVIGDIDFFKKINDNFSHATGDAVLRQVGEILRSHMRLSDLVARYGGEEFVIAFPETELPQAAALCDKLRGIIESFPWHQVHPELKVTMSMGVYADLAAGTAEAMLQKADALLYRAKETGRNRVCFAA
ncbi:diguanylate cyclase (GGDEF) domain-containing protein [Duganella sp. CF402]|uniref:sensor domain-containing diguanylate cyclase n=1 Tax=unclassified Duganella TaxID=2636909 RepID=UPI0008D373E0|nr:MULTISPECIES: diguanylate cyclase [unclassified Duganella]RZT08037.1 diguanylate cyclase (GGDEF)-like protein [Duganella sp. BK701]SEM07849.1 diguanylate cyclase (GGDEF) domain-containing protein [Duganella sp. CF402]